jgi:hypothetical protein
MKYVAFLVVLCSISASHAQGIVLESYTGKRPDDIARLLAPFHEELASRGYASGDTLARRYEATVSRPALAKDGLPSDFEDCIERGHKAWSAGRYDEAISALGPMIDAAHASSGAFAQNQPLRARLLKALIAYALSQQRTGDLADAKVTLAEILRSFPDTELSRTQYGPDVFELYEAVRRAHQHRGRLAIKVPTDTTVVFVNERFENVGNVNKADVVPGEYRVYLQDANQLSRVHRVLVKADQTSELAIDIDRDAVLRTSASWTGFAFANAGERARLEARSAVDFARAVHAKSVIVVGLDFANGRQAIVGVLLDLRTGREIRRAHLSFDPEPTSERIRALARFLAGEAAMADLDVQVAEAKPEEPKPDVAKRGGRRWMLWTGIAAIGVGLGGGVLALDFVGDAHDAGDELKRVCAVSCTSAQSRTLEGRQDRANRNAIISGVAGGLVAATGVVFIALSRGSPSTSSVALVPRAGGAVATYSVAF